MGASMGSASTFKAISQQYLPVSVYLLLLFLLAVVFTSVPSIVIFACVGMCALVAIYNRPVLGLFTMMLLLSSILFEESTPLIPIGIGSFHFQDVILLMLLGIVMLRRFTGKAQFVRTPVDLPLTGFYLVALTASVVALKFDGLDARQMIRVLRSVTYYLSFFLVTNLITDRKQLVALINYFLATAAITAAAMIGQALVGESALLITGRVEQARTLGDVSSALRIVPPGQTLVFCSFVVALCMSAVKSVNWRIYIVLTMLYGAGVLLTYNRSFWVAFLLVFLLSAFLLPWQCYRRVLANTLIIVCLAATITFTLSRMSNLVHESYVSMFFRLTSLFDNSELIESRSVEDRLVENSYALGKIRENPLLGIGLGNAYRPSLFGADDQLTSYIHNAYLWILMDTGAFGLLFFVCFYSLCSFRGWIKCRYISDGKWRIIIAGYTLSATGMAFIALVNPIFMQGHSILVIAVVAGIIETAIRLNTSEHPNGT